MSMWRIQSRPSWQEILTPSEQVRWKRLQHKRSHRKRALLHQKHIPFLSYRHLLQPLPLDGDLCPPAARTRNAFRMAVSRFKFCRTNSS